MFMGYVRHENTQLIIYTLNEGPGKYVNKQPVHLKEDSDNSTIVVGEVTSTSSSLEILTKGKLNNETLLLYK